MKLESLFSEGNYIRFYRIGLGKSLWDHGLAYSCEINRFKQVEILFFSFKHFEVRKFFVELSERQFSTSLSEVSDGHWSARLSSTI